MRLVPLFFGGPGIFLWLVRLEEEEEKEWIQATGRELQCNIIQWLPAFGPMSCRCTAPQCQPALLSSSSHWDCLKMVSSISGNRVLEVYGFQIKVTVVQKSCAEVWSPVRFCMIIRSKTNLQDLEIVNPVLCFKKWKSDTTYWKTFRTEIPRLHTFPGPKQTVCLFVVWSLGDSQQLSVHERWDKGSFVNQQREREHKRDNWQSSVATWWWKAQSTPWLQRVQLTVILV